MDASCINCALGFIGLFLLPSIISPRWVWKTTSAWSFRNPEANEPSDAGYAMQRVGAIVSLLVLVGFMLVLPGLARDKEQSDQRQQYEDCLAEHAADQDEGLLSPEDWCENLSPSPDAP